MWWNILWAASGLYAAWVVFVAIFVGSLKEIRRTSWHYKLYLLADDFIPCYRPNLTTCNYWNVFLLLPFFGIVIAVTVFIVSSVMLLVRLFWHWIITPFFTGRVPEVYADYLGDLLDSDSVGNIDMRRFTPIPPFLWLVIAFWAWRAVTLLMGIIGGTSLSFPSFDIIVFTLGAAGISVTAFSVVIYKKRGYLKAGWAVLTRKFCRKLEVV